MKKVHYLIPKSRLNKTKINKNKNYSHAKYILLSLITTSFYINIITDIICLN